MSAMRICETPGRRGSVRPGKGPATALIRRLGAAVLIACLGLAGGTEALAQGGAGPEGDGSLLTPHGQRAPDEEAEAAAGEAPRVVDRRTARGEEGGGEPEASSEGGIAIDGLPPEALAPFAAIVPDVDLPAWFTKELLAGGLGALVLFSFLCHRTARRREPREGRGRAARRLAAQAAVPVGHNAGEAALTEEAERRSRVPAVAPAPAPGPGRAKAVAGGVVAGGGAAGPTVRPARAVVVDPRGSGHGRAGGGARSR
ncbi:MAG: hypothetical protein AAF074_04050 [Pseudomonadota bacterium]